MTYTRDNLPESGWISYIKRVPTEMIRIEGPFDVQTREGLMHCENGYLALDADGYPYPIAHDVQAATYLPLSPKNQFER